MPQSPPPSPTSPPLTYDEIKSQKSALQSSISAHVKSNVEVLCRGIQSSQSDKLTAPSYALLSSTSTLSPPLTSITQTLPRHLHTLHTLNTLASNLLEITNLSKSLSKVIQLSQTIPTSSPPSSLTLPDLLRRSYSVRDILKTLAENEKMETVDVASKIKENTEAERARIKETCDGGLKNCGGRGDVTRSLYVRTLLAIDCMDDSWLFFRDREVSGIKSLTVKYGDKGKIERMGRKMEEVGVSGGVGVSVGSSVSVNGMDLTDVIGVGAIDGAGVED
eukprot:CAMPEP_0118642146 /NCGR_PEP_ID=MMETSP0785-20121206/5684_1 /TAXON_ID=91992 /ORGANISM="Bolidomonas pacifica, Strain CCMP 1866" /LENGTH=276 /DNA_ID=CAMNT_0006533687 /DNA_START=204 /DNA_END=1031 /DNA_ORIENTATION=+